MPKKVRPLEDYYLPKDLRTRNKYAPKIHKTSAHFDSNIIAVYTNWKKFAYRKYDISEHQLKILSQLNNQQAKQTANCIAYNIHLPIQVVNKNLESLWERNFINMFHVNTKPTQKHTKGLIYRRAEISNKGKQLFIDLAAFHKKFLQL